MSTTEQSGSRTTDSMTARTSGWDAMVTSAGHRPHTHHQPSQRALATRSLTAVERLPKGSPERAEAMRAHFAEFAPVLGSASCRLPR